MATFITNMAGVIASLFQRFGFVGGTIVYILIFALIAYYVIKSRYENVFISKYIEQEFEDLRKKGKTDAYGKLLVSYGYSLLGNIYTVAIMAIGGLIYAYALREPLMDFVGFETKSMPFREYGYKVLMGFGEGSLSIIIYALLIAYCKTVVSRLICNQSIINSNGTDTVVSFLCFAACLALPVGFEMFSLGFTVCELGIVVVNLGPLKEKNMERKLANLSKYRKSTQEKKVEKAQEAKAKKQKKVLHTKK